MSFQRNKTQWRIRGEEITLGVRTHLSAIIDLSLENRADPSELLDYAQQLEGEGADLVDITGGPARPAVERPTPDEELPRLVPTLRKLVPRLALPVCVTTPNAETAARVLELGVAVIHDPSGLAFDEDLAGVVNESEAGLILGHMRGAPTEWPRQAPLQNLVETVSNELQAALLRAHRAGVDRRRVVVDPGLEQGKRGHENFDLLRRLKKLAPAGQGIQVTLADPDFLRESVRSPEVEKLAALAVAATLALESGAHILRVPRPEAVRHVAAAVDRIYRADEIRAIQTSGPL